MPTQESILRKKFFDYLFDKQEGYVCIAVAEKNKPRQSFRQSFFKWPNQKNDLLSFIESIGLKKHTWFCVNIFEKAERVKENALASDIVWADLDTCSPSDVEPPPNVVIESSPGRFQAIWKLDKSIPPEQAEEYSKRVAYEYNQDGADPSGWDITQLLRVPFTKNFKYLNAPLVKLVEVKEKKYDIESFEQLSPAPLSGVAQKIEDMPAFGDLAQSETILYKYNIPLKRTAFYGLYTVEPNRTDDWSKLLWRLINICLEVGMSAEETFVIANESACNKYRRDNRPMDYLWRDVSKAEVEQNKVTLITSKFQTITMPQLVSKNDVTDTFVNEYRSWAEEATDALVPFHDITAFVLLSAFTAGGLYLKASHGKMVPNLWALILGDSTLTRKTTAMRMGIDLITEIDHEIILATDGSVEGLLSGLSIRPSRTSLFYKDEVSGFIDSINRKDYLAGMPETLTQLYDVPPIYTRRLRKEVISISNPIFIFFGGGIRDKVYSLLTEEYVLSGFLPRFLVVSGEADISRIRRTGPAIESGVQKREALRSKLADMYENYNRMAEIKLGTGQSIQLEAGIEVKLGNVAWTRYGDIEMEMVNRASESPIRSLALPTFERLSRSCLKMAMLLAATRQMPDQSNQIEVTEQDINNAAWYIQDWGRYTIDLISNTGKGTAQRELEKILNTIRNNPGIPRGQIMQRHHLSKRQMDEIQGTLEDRGEIYIKKEGRGVKMWAA